MMPAGSVAVGGLDRGATWGSQGQGEAAFNGLSQHSPPDIPQQGSQSIQNETFPDDLFARQPAELAAEAPGALSPEGG